MIHIFVILLSIGYFAAYKAGLDKGMAVQTSPYFAIISILYLIVAGMSYYFFG